MATTTAQKAAAKTAKARKATTPKAPRKRTAKTKTPATTPVALDLPEGVEANADARVEAARREHAAIAVEARKPSAKRTKVATPNLDYLRATDPALVQQVKLANGSTTTKATSQRRPTTRGAESPIEFRHDDKPMVPNMNTVACLAYNFTKGLDGDRPRISTKELRAILADAGITSPETTAWSHTLANGIVLSAVLR